MGKPKQDIIFKCEKCGYIPEGKLQGNWMVIDNKPCIKCGGKLTVDFITRRTEMKEEEIDTGVDFIMDTDLGGE